jgi:hypothetical protein
MTLRKKECLMKKFEPTGFHIDHLQPQRLRHLQTDELDQDPAS